MINIQQQTVVGLLLAEGMGRGMADIVTAPVVNLGVVPAIVRQNFEILLVIRVHGIENVLKPVGFLLHLPPFIQGLHHDSIHRVFIRLCKRMDVIRHLPEIALLHHHGHIKLINFPASTQIAEKSQVFLDALHMVKSA